MSVSKVYCKDCVWMSGYEDLSHNCNRCVNPKINTRSEHPITGIKIKGVGLCLMINATCTCPDHTPKDGGKRE